MAKTLITTPFPTIAEVAESLGVSPTRVRQLAALMPFTVPASDLKGLRPLTRKKTAKGKSRRRVQR